MSTVDNLLIMEHCASCDRELAPHWKYCLYCGRPFVAAPIPSRSAVQLAPKDGLVEPPPRRYDGAFWVGVGMGVLGLVLIVYAAIQIYGSQV